LIAIAVFVACSPKRAWQSACFVYRLHGEIDVRGRQLLLRAGRHGLFVIDQRIQRRHDQPVATAALLSMVLFRGRRAD
jgi:hypothetical protein